MSIAVVLSVKRAPKLIMVVVLLSMLCLRDRLASSSVL